MDLKQQNMPTKRADGIIPTTNLIATTGLQHLQRISFLHKFNWVTCVSHMITQGTQATRSSPDCYVEGTVGPKSPAWVRGELLLRNMCRKCATDG